MELNKVKVYARSSTAPIWYTTEPDELSLGCNSYYTREVNKSEIKNGVYIDNRYLNVSKEEKNKVKGEAL